MIFVYALLIALFWALILSVIFASLPTAYGYRRQDDAGCAGILFFFVIVWLATWGVGVWVRPGGPVLWGVPWLWFLCLAIIFALLLASAAPAPRRTRRRNITPIQPPPETAGQALPAESTSEEEAVVAVFSIFFWILLLVIIISLIARYAWWRTP